MGITMDAPVSQMNLSLLADRCTGEIKHHRRKEPFDDRYCLEIFRRAIVEHIDKAWSTLQQCFGEIVRIWLRSHPSSDVALLRDSEENYVAQTFSRFWYAVRRQHIEFLSQQAALSYLRTTLNAVILDTLRYHTRTREVALPDPDIAEELVAPDTNDGHLLLDTLKKLLADEREQRLAYLLYYCGLKPREIVIHCAAEFNDIKEIYRLNHNITEKLRRNRDRLRWLLGNIE